eukprot:CAMPEP_0116961798 /NCGR_PEP_ID=MMETSP0467-20121206/46813_1 /TAXON_ID=283647 /ORGANISM="Mesodinium pulex, Strain SPMC105" /LENGTH=82 /DNA_ID=CAMNT_0004649871 /DNA_START=876 /DNA_END=1124 /DNA_ORIENTATION=+
MVWTAPLDGYKGEVIEGIEYVNAQAVSRNDKAEKRTPVKNFGNSNSGNSNNLSPNRSTLGREQSETLDYVQQVQQVQQVEPN